MCEDACRRKLVEERIGICFLKRFAADCDKAAGDRYHGPFEKLVSGELELPYRALHDRLGPEHRLPDDPHTNAEGDRVIAEALLELLQLN